MEIIGYQNLLTEENVILDKKEQKKTKKLQYKLLYFIVCIILIHISFNEKFTLKNNINTNNNESLNNNFEKKNQKKLGIDNSNIINFKYNPNEIPLTAKNKSPKSNNLKVALCTMGKNENLYVKEFIDYYIRLGIDHIFIYDDNDPKIERISDEIENKYKPFVTVYEERKKINHQSKAFTTCYNNNKDKFDWFLMVDMDEFLYIKDNTLKDYLSQKVFDKCDFIKFHWVCSTDNNLIHYEPKPLFERFTGPFIKYKYIKSMIRGGIPQLEYWVHSPKVSPIRNVTCENTGKRLNFKKINWENKNSINIEKAFIIHFRYKSTEEFVMKYKRGYSNWFGKRIQNFLNNNIADYLNNNELTMDKILYLEKELKVNLEEYKKKLKLV